MLQGYDPVDLLVALGAGFACASSTRRRRPDRWVTLPIMIFLGLDPATANAKRYVFVLLVLAISAELVQLAWHYDFRAMWLAG